ncbi:MAG: AAA family ATPase, partial [Cyanobacteriota bacterium]
MELPYDKCQRELQDLLQAQYPLIFLRSPEESRAINCAVAAHQALISGSEIKDGELARWSSIDGFQRRAAIAENPTQANW